MKSADPPDSAIRLCLATPQFYPTYGGAEQRYLRYLPGLSASGLDVTVFTGTATDEMITRGDALNVEWKAHPVGSVLPPEVINGSPVYRLRLPTRKGPHRRWMFSQRLDRFCRDPATRPDVVQLLGTVRIGTVPWVKRLQRLGIPTLYALTTASKIVRKKRFLDTGLMKFRALFSTMDAVVTNSASVGDALKEMGVSTRIEVIPNGVDIERFRPAPSREIHRSVRAELEIGAEAQLVIAIGAVMARKGSDLLLDAFLRVARENASRSRCSYRCFDTQSHPRNPRGPARSCSRGGLRSIRQVSPEIPIMIIPGDDFDHENHPFDVPIMSAPGSFWSGIEHKDRSFWPFQGPFETFLFLDADIICVKSLDKLMQRALRQRGDFIFVQPWMDEAEWQDAVQDPTHPKHQYCLEMVRSEIGRGPLSEFDPNHNFLARRPFNTGAFVSRRSVIRESDLAWLYEAEQKFYREVLQKEWSWRARDLFFYDQGRMNYLIAKRSTRIQD